MQIICSFVNERLEESKTILTLKSTNVLIEKSSSSFVAIRAKIFFAVNSALKYSLHWGVIYNFCKSTVIPHIL